MNQDASVDNDRDASRQAAPAPDAVAEQNKRRIVDFWRSGAHERGGSGLLGLEVEHQVVAGDGRPVFYEPQDGIVGVREVLEGIADAFPEPILGADGDVIGRGGPAGEVTLEPAGQIEDSVAPHADVAKVMAGYDAFRAAVDPFLASHGAHLEAVGYSTCLKAADAVLIPKRRYHFMSDYFAALGTHAERMMRATASTQVSVDYYDEADAIRKMRVAAALTPVLSAMMDDVRVFEGEPNHLPLRRMYVWEDVDPARCGIQPGLFDAGYGFGRMAEWLLDTPPIFVTRPAADDPEGDGLRPTGSVTAREAYADAPMSEGDVEHLISMFWPHVRLKRVVEIRPADSAPRDAVAGYVALIKGLFYSEASLAAVEEAIGVRDGAWPLGDGDVEKAIASVQEHGLAAEVYGRTLSAWEELLLGLAGRALPEGEAALLGPLRAFAADKPWWEVR